MAPPFPSVTEHLTLSCEGSIISTTLCFQYFIQSDSQSQSDSKISPLITASLWQKECERSGGKHILFFFFLFTAAPMAYGTSHMSELHLQLNTTAYGNARSLTH